MSPRNARLARPAALLMLGLAAAMGAPAAQAHRPPPEILVSTSRPMDLGRSPEPSLEVRGQKWKWTVSAGQVVTDQLTLPVATWVKLSFRSRDVEHRFTIPGLLDVDIPAKQTVVRWLRFNRMKSYRTVCSVSCTPKVDFTIAVHIVDGPSFQRALVPSWRPAAVWGERLFTDKGCDSCHGRGRLALSSEGLWGSTIEQADGSKVHLAGAEGEAFLREAISAPAKRITKGYSNIMPGFAGVLTKPELDALVQYYECTGRDACQQPACAALKRCEKH